MISTGSECSWYVFSSKKSLEQFLKIMLHHSDMKDEERQVEYVEALIDAFKQIDVNGDASLEWDEFSNYIVETGTYFINLKVLLNRKNLSSMS